MSSTPLPERASIESLKKLAKDRLQLRARVGLPQLLAVARDHGFRRHLSQIRPDALRVSRPAEASLLKLPVPRTTNLSAPAQKEVGGYQADGGQWCGERGHGAPAPYHVSLVQSAKCPD